MATLLLSAADSYTAKPFERKKPRDWMLAGGLTGNEELATQPPGGYLRGSETTASLAYTDKASTSTTNKTSATSIAKTNSPPIASYGEKTAAPPSTAPPANAPVDGTTTTITDAAKQGVSSVIVPWGSVTASYSSTEAPTPAWGSTGSTGGGLYHAGMKVDNPTASTTAEKSRDSFNTKTEPSPSASNGEKTATTTPLPTAPSTSTLPYSATDTVKQGAVVSSVIVPWGSANSKASSYSSTRLQTPTEDNGGLGYGAGVNVQPRVSKSTTQQSDSGVRGEDKVSQSQFSFLQGSATTSTSTDATSHPDENEYGADGEITEPAYNSPVGRVIPWNDGRPQLGTEKPTSYRDHAQADAYSDGNDDTKSQNPVGNLVPWSHSLIERELQAGDIEQPTDQPTAEESSDKTEGQPAGTSADKPAEQAANQPSEKSVDQSIEDGQAADGDEMMKTTTVVVDANVRWNQDDCDPCDVPTQPPTLSPLYPRKDDDYELHLPSVTDESKSWENVKEEPVHASTKSPKKRGFKPPKADLIHCTKVIGEYGESYECDTLPPNGTEPPTETPYGSTPSPEPPGTESPRTEPPPTETPQETPAPTATEPPTEAPYPSEPATTSPPTAPTPSPTKPVEPTPSPTKPGERTPAPTRPSEPTPSPTKGNGESSSTPVSTIKGTSTFPTGTKASTSKTSTPAATSGTSTTTTTTSTDTTGNNAYGTSGTTSGSNDSVVGVSTSEGNTSSGSSGALSGGAIAGIVIACVVFVAVVVGAVFFRQRSIARQREENLFADLASGGGRALETDYAAM
ncbi:hypothetical protein ON010_g11763 [Phytophthora cinnamomi]|nr:hypothetical protein ON010_g11763 [Phytophthora cinnamomi]